MASGYKDPEYMKKYQAANREEINAKARARYAANREREVARASAGAELWPYEWLGRWVSPVNAFLEKWGPRGR